MTIPPIDIAAHEWHLLQTILQKHIPDLPVWAFGSRAKGTARRYSDLDLAIITETPLSFEVHGDLADEFSESDLPFRVDILDWATTEAHFRRIVERDKVIVQLGKSSNPIPPEASHAVG